MNYSNSDLYSSTPDMDKRSPTGTTLLWTFYSKHELLLAALIEIFLAVVGTFRNCLVCVAILKNTSLQIAANFYMLSLTIADLLVTAVLVPMRAAQNFAFYNNEAVQGPVVHVFSFIGRVTILASISSLAALTSDRRMALKHPLKYRTVIRYAKGRAVKVVLGIWAFSLVFTSITLLPGVPDAVFLIGFTSFVLTVTAVIIFAYGNIFLLVRRSVRWRASPSYSYYVKRNKITLPLNSLPPTNCARLKKNRDQPKTSKEGLQSMDSFTAIERTQKVSNHRRHKIEEEQSTGMKRRPECLSGATQFDMSFMGMTRKKGRAMSIKENNDAVSSHTNTAERILKCKQKLRPKIPPKKACTEELQSQINWRTMDTPPSSSTEKHDLERPNSVEIELHNERKTRRNTHPRLAQLNSSRSQKERRKTIGHPASSVKRKRTLGSYSRWKMRQKIEPNAFQPQIEHKINTEQASSITKSEPTHDGSLNADLRPRCFLKMRKEFEPRRTQIKPVRASKTGTKPTQLLYNSRVRDTGTSLSRSHDHDQEKEPGTTNNLAMQSARPRFGAIPSRQSERQSEFKIAKTTAIIVTLFILLVYPRIILIIYSLSAPTKLTSVNHAKLWIRILLYSNSVVNPFLYSLRHREIWREFTKWFAPCACKKRQSVRVE